VCTLDVSQVLYTGWSGAAIIFYQFLLFTILRAIYFSHRE